MATNTDGSARRRAISIAATGLLALAMVGFAGTAANATPAQRSCSIDIGTGTTVCVSGGEDLNAAVLRQAHLRVVVPGGATGRTVSALLAPASSTTVYVQAQLYSYPGYGGTMLQITNSSGCDGSTVYEVGNLASLGFDNDTDSFRSFSDCTTRIWDGANFSGTSYGYRANSTDVGAMANRASSVQIR